MALIFKRTKILATVGPATNSPEMIEKLMLAGANGLRLNFSHGNNEERDQQIAWIRETSKKLGKPVAILQDLQGPKIRLGALQHDTDVKTGDILTLDFAAEHDGLVVPIQYNLAPKVKVGEPLYIFDGKIRTTVSEISSDTAIKVHVENPGTLMSRKGLNLPDTDFGGDILTAKDLSDIEWGSTRDFDYVAISFIQSADDINKLRSIMEAQNYNAKIIAKVETKAAIVDDALEEIIKASDGVMVARGDLAFETGPEVVPIVQRRIIRLCRKYGKISIVATQMMASMCDTPEPTRAEVSDVSNAVVQGTDAVMLSEETAMGKYPIETVAAMKKVILYTQDHESVMPIAGELAEKKKRRDAISVAAIDLADKLHAGAIITEAKFGATAANISSHRPTIPVISATVDPRSAQQLSLSYANRNYIRPSCENEGYKIARELKDQGFFGDEPLTVIIVSGRKIYDDGTNDNIRICTIK